MDLAIEFGIVANDSDDTRKLKTMSSQPQPVRRKFAVPPVKVACLECRASRCRCDGNPVQCSNVSSLHILHTPYPTPHYRPVANLATGSAQTKVKVVFMFRAREEVRGFGNARRRPITETLHQPIIKTWTMHPFQSCQRLTMVWFCIPREETFTNAN